MKATLPFFKEAFVKHGFNQVNIGVVIVIGILIL